MFKFLFHIFRILLILFLPFIALIRGATFLHKQYDWYPWISLAGGIVLTSIVLVIYLSLVFGKVSGKIGGPKSLRNRWIFVLLILLGFAVHGLFFLSSDNAKRDEVKKEFTSLHPILRIAVSTLIWVDKDLVITDAKRAPEDYKKMGLETAKQSLHYPQKDGYSYAFDMRTNNRSEVRNFLTKTYFNMMGFNTLRHVGTEDHLHISLYCKYRKGAI